MNFVIAALGAFNLVCTGTITIDGAPLSPNSDYSYTYRIDLDAEKWCEADCKTIHKIAAVQPAQITLTDSHDKDPVLGESKMKAFINRETGRHTVIANSVYLKRPMTMGWDGQCERLPFSGFPKFETKF
jgi:hypothetical protein